MPTRSYLALTGTARLDQIERAVVLQLLTGRGGSPRCDRQLSLGTLQAALQPISLVELEKVIERLDAQGVLDSRGGQLEVSGCTRRIAELGLLSV